MGKYRRVVGEVGKNPSPCNNLLMVSYEQEVLCVETAAAGTSCDSSTLHTIKRGNEAQGVSVKPKMRLRWFDATAWLSALHRSLILRQEMPFT